MEQFKQFLQAQFSIRSDQWDLVSSHFCLESLTRDTYFIREGAPCRKAGFVLEGVLRYFGHDDKGDELTCYFAAENDYVIEPFSFPTQSPATFNLQLVTDCRIATISFEKNRSLLSLLPAWTEISNTMIQRAMAEFANQKKMIAYDAAGRYELFLEEYPQFAQRVPLQYVASYLGIAQPSLSRLRKQMATKKNER
ncbi:MAG: Crp/Fnr family transcriptional regulator [Chitinophagaceae bacterium]|nr:Crp/Fnr family transcriptional regulator [Chitinophagaceae bacterium]